MRFSMLMMTSAAVHAYVLWAVAGSHPPSLPLARGEFCVELRASFASLPSPERDAPRKQLDPDPTPPTNEPRVTVEKPPVEKPMVVIEPVPAPQELVAVEQPTATTVPLQRESIPPPQPVSDAELDERADAVNTSEPVESNNPTPLPASKPQPASKPSTPHHQGVTRGVNLPNHYKPVYPREAQLRGIEGQVLLAVRVGATGEAVEVSVAQSSGYPILDEAAEVFARSVRFQPAQQRGVAIEAAVTLPVVYRLRD